MKKKICLIFYLINVISSFSQINIEGAPFSIKNNMSLDSIPVYLTENIEEKKLFQEDVIDEKNNIPPRFGYKFKTNITIDNIGRWSELSNGDKIWQLRIKTKKSLSINLLFRYFHLNNGSIFHLFRADKKQVLGGFSEINNKGNLITPGNFATGLLYGDDIILELYQPIRNNGKDKFCISNIVHGYRMINIPEIYQNKYQLKNFGDAGSCQVNVNCSEGTDWQDEKKGVALMIVDGNRFCTGCLVNNTSNDGKLFFLTAYHCISFPPSNDPSNLSFIWDYESSGCGNPSSEPSTSKTTNGSVLRTTNQSIDMALLELTKSPYNLSPPYFAFF